MGSSDVESGFEALLKPLQDINSKMWDIMLTTALEKYLVVINNGDTSVVNFTEAAVLVQNSANFYCKRVDSVYLGCRQFVEKLINTGDKDDGEDDGQGTRKKRKNKFYNNENFEMIDLFETDANIDVNLDTIDKYADQKKVILDKYVKATKKPNISCPVFQAKGSEMGFKDEFRLHWGIESSGTLHEDFVTTKNSPTINWEVLSDDVCSNDPEAEELRDFLNQGDDMLDNPAMDDDNGGPPPLSPPCPIPSPLPPNSPLAAPPLLLQSENIPLENQTDKEYYAQRKFNFVIPPKPVFKSQPFSLSKSLIDEITDWKKRRLENKAHSDNPFYTFDTYFDFMKHQYLLKKATPEEEKYYQSAKKKRLEIKCRQKQSVIAAMGAAENYENDFNGFCDNGIENDDVDIELDNVEGLVVVDIPSGERDTTKQDREEMMATFQENKRRFAAELTQVAHRVQAWHESLASVLEAAEARSQYDVHQYGTRILEVFKEPPKKKPIVSFINILKDQPDMSKAEVSRYLLSSLMLANTYNVAIVQEGGELDKDCLSLQLLSTVRHHEEMDENLKSNTLC